MVHEPRHPLFPFVNGRLSNRSNIERGADAKYTESDLKVGATYCRREGDDILVRKKVPCETDYEPHIEFHASLPVDLSRGENVRFDMQEIEFLFYLDSRAPTLARIFTIFMARVEPRL